MGEQVTAGFHHITMVSANAQRTLAFYRDLLGVPLVKRTVNFDDPDSYHLYFGSNGGEPGTLVTFFEWPRSRRGNWGVGGIHHLALGTSTRESQLMWKRRLNDAGVSVRAVKNFCHQHVSPFKICGESWFALSQFHGIHFGFGFANPLQFFGFW